jgi:hypothetical protein
MGGEREQFSTLDNKGWVNSRDKDHLRCQIGSTMGVRS